MDDASDWISAREAAELTGIAEHTIEWWIRQGRIRQRQRHGGRPTLARSSVEEFAATFVPKGQRPPKQRAGGPSRAEWFDGYLTVADVQAATGVCAGTVGRWVASGVITAERHPTRVWLRFTPDEVARLVAERHRWVSTIEAAELAGTTVGRIRGAAKRGEVRARGGPGSLPGFDRASVAEYGRRLGSSSQQGGSAFVIS